MKATPQTVWRPPAYLPYLQPTLTPELVAQAEQRLGVTLPAEYLALLEVQNGGYIRYGLPDLVHDVIRGIGPHYPNLLDFDWDHYDDAPSFPLEGLIPFDGDGHWYLCLDYRSRSQEPAVAFIDVECDEQCEIAPSFAAYLALLEYDAPSGVVLTPVAEIVALIAHLEARLKITFEPPDSWSYGYPIYSASVATKKKPEWICWLSPNTIPRGFVRESDRRYAELRDLLPGTALRFPELPPESYLLNVSGKRQSAVLAACAKLGVTARPAKDYLS